MTNWFKTLLKVGTGATIFSAARDILGFGSADGLGCAGDGPSTYTVQAGDTLTSIAAQFSTSVDALLAANPSIEDPDLIVEGSELTVPAAGEGLPGRLLQRPMLCVVVVQGGCRDHTPRPCRHAGC
jgi:hypothetical protein